MEDRSVHRLPGSSKPWSRRVLDLFREDACRCAVGAECPDGDCSYYGSDVCPVREWTEDGNGGNGRAPASGAPPVDGRGAGRDRPTLNMVDVGEKTCVEQLYLPLAAKKRLLSLGLTPGAEVAVISNEKGRMIISVRDSRLGLSPETASRITCRSAGRERS